MFEQASRKRAGTSTSATLSEPAQRGFFMATTTTSSDINSVKAELVPIEHSDAKSTFPRYSVSQLNHGSDAIIQYTPATTPDLKKSGATSLPSSRVTSTGSTKSSKARAGTPIPRAVYPFPPQVPSKSVLNDKDLRITTSHSEPTIDALWEQAWPQFEFEPRPPSPHSHTDIATILASSYSPIRTTRPTSSPPPDFFSGPRPSIASDYTTVSATSSISPPISPWPSMSSNCTTAYSPVSPTTPRNSSTIFDSAAAALKRVLVADDLNMLVTEISELSEAVAGLHEHRAFVKKKTTMRRDNSHRRVSKASSGGRRRSSAISGSSLDPRSRESLVSSSRISGSGAGPGSRRSTAGSSSMSSGTANSGLRGIAARSSTDVHDPIQAGEQYLKRPWTHPQWREINWSGTNNSSSATSSTLSDPGPMSTTYSQPGQQGNQAVDFGAGMDVDSQEESDGDDYMKIDGRFLGLPRAYPIRRDERRRELDMTRSMPDKVGTRVAVWGPCAGGYCCGTCGRCK